MTFREFLNEGKSKIKDMSKSEIKGEVEYLIGYGGTSMDSSDLSEYIDSIHAYLISEYGGKSMSKALAKKIMSKKV